MLALSRKPLETIIIEGPCVITVVEVGRNKVRIGIDAAREVKILRGELKDVELTEQREKAA